MLPTFLNDLNQNNQHQPDFVEVTLELQDDDSIIVYSVTPTAEPPPPPDQASTTLQRNLSISARIRQKFPWLRSASSRASTSSDHLHEPACMSARDARRMNAKIQRSTSSAQRALKGLRFISKTTGDSDSNELWRKVESRFQSLANDGLLAREDFGECIGMVDSKEFAVGIFDVLVRRRRQMVTRITKQELYEFWLQISDQSFDARLQIFFDM